MTIENALPPQHSELGKSSDYDAHYNPGRLFAIPRQLKRDEIFLDSAHLPFYGYDCWNHYEVSCLNEKGKPMVAVVEMYYDCRSPNIIESKSLKLYFNSFNNTAFHGSEALCATIQKDLEKVLQTNVLVRLFSIEEAVLQGQVQRPEGECLDGLDIDCDTYTVCSDFLQVDASTCVEEQLHSNLLKSNCLVTQQPDWGTVYIHYKGPKIQHEGLLRYIVSFRNHTEFHEQCIERIFVDIMRQCHPDYLEVYGRYTRRGGIDINPLRCSTAVELADRNPRFLRQ